VLSEYFGIHYDEVFNELCPYYESDYELYNFIKKFNIDMKKRYYNKIYITCRHAITVFDELEYLKKNGLLNLKQMLQRESPLSLFLLKNHINIDIEKKILNYNNSSYRILHRDEKCNKCIFEEFQCKSFFNNKLPDYKSCDYRDKLSFLEGKLYYDKCETEVFIDGTLKDIYGYYSVRYSPEILSTIENITYFYDNKMGNLQNKWTNIPNNKYCILEFDSEISNFELISTNGMYERYWEIGDVLESFGYNEVDFIDGNVSPILYQNLFILKRLINNFTWGNGEKYGQLFPTTIIEGNSIRVIRKHNINDRAKEEL
jgi:hypothetical protein